MALNTGLGSVALTTGLGCGFFFMVTLGFITVRQEGVLEEGVTYCIMVGSLGYSEVVDKELVTNLTKIGVLCKNNDSKQIA